MIDYHPISLSDKDLIKDCLSAKDSLNCEYSLGNIICYGEVLGLEVALCCGCFVSRSFEDGSAYYCFPFGKGDVAAALTEIVDEIRRSKKPSLIYGMSESEAELFNEMFGDEERAVEERDFFDYCYETETLISLSGKKYQSKRNHISFFERNNNWSFELMTSSHASECLEMNRQWLNERLSGDREELETEFAVIERAFRYFDDLPFRGIVLRADGRIIAFAIGEELDGDHFCIHFEKAFSSVRGSYAMINRLFAEKALSSYRYINREDDAGQENLRKSKLSYHPAYFVKKFQVSFNNAAD